MGNEIIVWKTRDPLGGLAPERFEAELVRLLTGKVNAAYFFGSFGRPEFGSDSDIDLILVLDTEKPFLDRAREFSDILDLVPAMDLLVYTPSEFESLTQEPTAGFWRSVTASLRRII